MAKTDSTAAVRKQADRVVKRQQEYKQTFTTPQGKAVLLDMLHEHYMLRPTFAGGSTESLHELAFREGQRNVMLRVMTVMGLDTAQMYLLLKETEDNVRSKNS